MSMTATQPKSAPVAGTYQPKGMLIGGKWVEQRFGRSASPSRIPAKRTADRRSAARRRRRCRCRRRGGRQGLRRRGRRSCRASAARLLLKIAEAIEARAEEMARTIALETGNALRTQARGEASWRPTSSAISAGSPAS